MKNSVTVPNKPVAFDTYQNSAEPIMEAKATAYGILPAAITAIILIKEKWDGLVAICDSGSTKGPGATANRNKYFPTYRNAILSILNLYLVDNDNVTAADKLTFNIHTPLGSKTSIPAPSSTVHGIVSYMEPLAQYFNFVDTVSGKKGKPAGVAFVELRYVVDTVAPASVFACPLSIYVCRNNLKALFVSSEVGKKAYYYGRYINRNGKMGPWCAMFSATIV